MADLTLKITGDSKDAQKAVQDLRNSIQGEAQRINASFQNLVSSDGKIAATVGQLSQGFQSVSGGADLAALATGGATAALGALAAVGAVTVSTLISIARAASEYAGKFADASAETGFTVEKLQLLNAVGAASGTTLEQITSGILQFEDRLISAADGNEKLAATFQRLGINATKAANDPEKAFFKLAETLNNVENSADRVALAKDLVGKSGTKLLKVFSDLANGGDDLEAKLKSLGIILNNETITALDDFGDKWAEVQLTAQGALNLIAKEFVPVLNVALQDLLGSATDLKDIWPKIGLEARKFFIDVIVGAKSAFFEIQKLGSGLQKIFIPDEKADTFDKVLKKWKDGLGDLRDALRGNEEEIRSKFLKGLEDYEKELKKQAEESQASARRVNNTTAQEKAKKEAERLLREQLQTLNGALREQDDLYKKSAQQIQSRFDERLSSEALYTSDLIAAIRTRNLEESRLLAAQIQRTNEAPNLSNQEKLKAIDVLRAEQVNAARDADAEIAKVEFGARQRKAKAEEDLQQLLLQGLARANDRKLALIQEQVEAEILSYEDGAEKITAILLAELDKRIEAQQAIADAAKGFADENVEAERLRQLEAEKTAAVEAGTRNRQRARLRDIAAERNATAELARIYAGARQARLEFEATFAGNAVSVIQQSAASQKKALEEEFELQRQLAEERIAQIRAIKAEDEAAEDSKQSKIIEINNRIVALEEEKNARIRAINRQAQVDAELATPNSNRNVLGADTADALNALEIGNAVIGKQTTLFEQVNVAMSRYAANLRQQLPTAAQTVVLSLRAMANAAAASIAAFVSGEATIRQAAAGIVNAALEPYKQKAQAKAAIEFAEAASSFAIGDIAGGVKHTGAGILWSGVAGLLGGIGNLIAGNGGAGAANTPSLAGTRQDQNTISTEERFRLRESGPGRPVTTIVLVTDRQMLVKDVEFGFAQSYANDGTARKVIDNATGGRPY